MPEGEQNDNRRVQQYTNETCSDDEESDEEEDEENGNRVAEVLRTAGPTNIHMENTSDVQVGPRLFYTAPVTVNQTVHVLNGQESTIQYALKAPLHDLQGNSVEKQKFERSSFLTRWRWFLIGGFVIIVLVLIMVLAVVLSSIGKTSNIVTHEEKPTLFPSVPPDSPRNESLILPGNKRIYRKADWYGKKAKFERPQRHPVPFVVIAHTVTEPCYNYANCAEQMRNMQNVYLSGAYADLGYSFVVSGDGSVYESRGWDVTTMHVGYVRYCNLGIALIGDFVQDLPTIQQLNATQELIKLGVKLGKIDENYKLVPMNETGNTLSPGRNVYKIIKNWPNFWVPNEKDPGMCPFDTEP